MSISTRDPKQRAILEAAWGGFATYGYRKTSMDDIAKRAGMSRPAVYLHFRNKEAILKAMIDAHYADTTGRVRDALVADGELGERLQAAFCAQGGEVMEAMLSTPHGMEVLEASVSTAGDHIEAGEAAMRKIYEQWLVEAEAASQVHLPGEAADIARTFCSAMKGVKHTAADYVAYRAGVCQLAQLFSAALRPG
ncbi:TetR/AcrR family transcriptional regulator [Phaeobacter sp. C3_T13_0]|uniref:TetR/AcrR family transcriptional regulator n=1 Tax=Phaeobacter cretensis TaxID=3342641 RepID=UPI0039BC4D6A